MGCLCGTPEARAWLSAYVVEQLPTNLTKLVSPFVGGASVEIACARELGIEVKAYDVFDILTNYWQIQLRSPVELAQRIAEWEPTKDVYASVKRRLKGNGTVLTP